MTNVVKIRETPIERMRRTQEAEKARHLERMRDRMEQTVSEAFIAHGEGVTKALLLDIARKFFPQG